MLASPRAKSEEFASATLSGSVLRTPTHFANAAWYAASSALSGEAGVPFQPAGRSAGCSTIFFSCASEAGAADDDAAELLLDDAAELLDGAVELALAVEGDLDEEVQPANRVTAHPAAQTEMRRLIRMTRDTSVQRQESLSQSAAPRRHLATLSLSPIQPRYRLLAGWRSLAVHLDHRISRRIPDAGH